MLAGLGQGQEKCDRNFFGKSDRVAIEIVHETRPLIAKHHNCPPTKRQLRRPADQQWRVLRERDVRESQTALHSAPNAWSFLLFGFIQSSERYTGCGV